MVSSSSVRRIAWSIYWKMALVSLPTAFLAGGVVGFVIGFVGGLAGFEQASVLIAIQVLSSIAGFLVSFLIFTYFLAQSVGREIGGKRLELVVAEGV
jgi:hypothetical protein